MLKNIYVFSLVLLTSALCFQITTANAGPVIQQAVLGHLSMSIPRCQSIAKEICESKSNMCTINQGAAIFAEDYTLGIQCSKLGRGITIMIVFGAVKNGKGEDAFNDLLVGIVDEAYPYFR